MLFKNIVRNLSNNVCDNEVYCKLIDDYANSLTCKGFHCDNLGETKKTIVFLARENTKKREVEEINKEFWMGIFHDIKNPMISIDFALRGIDDTDDNKGVLKDIHNLNQANLEFIRAILENYRFEEGFFEQKYEKINLKEFLKELTGNYKYLLMERGLRIDLSEVEEDLALNFCSVSISRVFLNLIANAIKFANKDSEIIIEGKALERGRNVVFISIANYGEKIKDTEGIFQKFTSHTGSSGLGLHICRKIIKDAGGKIWAENFDNGAKFCLLLNS